MNKFDYLLDKIKDARFENSPFQHIYIENFFSAEDFQEIITSHSVNIPTAQTDAELIDTLHARHFKEIGFPGTTTDVETYIEWHKDPSQKAKINQETCEGFGMMMRLQQTNENSIIEHAQDFFSSDAFFNALVEKFEITQTNTHLDSGLQKYLDGYEISPHPDTRQKALTYMVNINPAKNAEEIEYHTHYLTFKPERAYIQTYWEGHPEYDRCWVPWDWCTTVKRQTKNNSIVLFAPADDTLHAVRAKYDHLKTQRTQFYGNIWFQKYEKMPQPEWSDFEISINGSAPEESFIKKILQKF